MTHAASREPALHIRVTIRSGEHAELCKGLGYKLIDMVIGIAQEKGLEKIYGIVLTDNKAMLRICQELGFRLRDLADGTTWVELALR